MPASPPPGAARSPGRLHRRRAAAARSRPSSGFADVVGAAWAAWPVRPGWSRRARPARGPRPSATGSWSRRRGRHRLLPEQRPPPPAPPRSRRTPAASSCAATTRATSASGRSAAAPSTSRDRGARHRPAPVVRSARPAGAWASSWPAATGSGRGGAPCGAVGWYPGSDGARPNASAGQRVRGDRAADRLPVEQRPRRPAGPAGRPAGRRRRASPATARPGCGARWRVRRRPAARRSAVRMPASASGSAMSTSPEARPATVWRRRGAAAPAVSSTVGVSQ